MPEKYWISRVWTLTRRIVGRALTGYGRRLWHVSHGLNFEPTSLGFLSTEWNSRRQNRDVIQLEVERDAIRIIGTAEDVGGRRKRAMGCQLDGALILIRHRGSALCWVRQPGSMVLTVSLAGFDDDLASKWRRESFFI